MSVHLSSMTGLGAGRLDLVMPGLRAALDEKPVPLTTRSTVDDEVSFQSDAAAELLTTENPRNYHLSSPVELEATVSRTRHVSKQLQYFGSSQQESFIPQEVLLPLLLEDLSGTACAAVRTLRGNRLAACQVPHTQQVLLLSSCGQIGERLSLTVLQPGPAGGGPTWLVHTAAELSLQSEVLQVELKSDTTMTIHATNAHHTGQHQPAAGAGPSTSAQSGTAANASAPTQHHTTCVWVAVRCRGRVNVLLAMQEDPHDWSSWALEWRGTLPCVTPPMCIAWSPVLPELALLLDDGSVMVASTSACAVLDASELVVPLPLPCTWVEEAGVLLPGSGIVLGVKGEGLGVDQVPPHDLSLSEAGCRGVVTYGMHPRTLLVACGRALWRCTMHGAGRKLAHPTILHHLPPQELFTALATALDSTAGAVEPQQWRQQLLPYLAAATTQRTLLLDTRHPQSPLLAWKHGLVHPPTMLSLSPLPQAQPQPLSQVVEGRAAGHTHAGTSQVAAQGTQQLDALQSAHVGFESQDSWGRAFGAQLPEPFAETQESQMDRWNWTSSRPSGALTDTGIGSTGATALGARVLLTWGSEALGQVRGVELCVRPSSIGLAPQQDEAGAAHGAGDAAPGPGLAVLLLSAAANQGQGGQGQAPAGLLGAAVPPTTVSALPPLAWQPACLDIVQCMGLPQELSSARSLLQHPRRSALEAGRALLHSAGVSTSRGSAAAGSGSTAAATARAEARAWGMQLDVGQRRVALMRAHVRASRDAADLHGLAVLPLPITVVAQQEGRPATRLLMLRLSSDGDVAVQTFRQQPAAMRLLQPAAVPPVTQSADADAAAAGPSQQAELNKMPIELLDCSRNPQLQTAVPDSGDVRFRLLARYPTTGAAQRLVLGVSRASLEAHKDRFGKKAALLRHHHARMARLLRRALAHALQEQLTTCFQLLTQAADPSGVAVSQPAAQPQAVAHERTQLQQLVRGSKGPLTLAELAARVQCVDAALPLCQPTEMVPTAPNNNNNNNAAAGPEALQLEGGPLPHKRTTLLMDVSHKVHRAKRKPFKSRIEAPLRASVPQVVQLLAAEAQAASAQSAQEVAGPSHSAGAASCTGAEQDGTVDSSRDPTASYTRLVAELEALCAAHQQQDEQLKDGADGRQLQQAATAGTSLHTGGAAPPTLPRTFTTTCRVLMRAPYVAAHAGAGHAPEGTQRELSAAGDSARHQQQVEHPYAARSDHLHPAVIVPHSTPSLLDNLVCKDPHVAACLAAASHVMFRADHVVPFSTRVVMSAPADAEPPTPAAAGTPGVRGTVPPGAASNPGAFPSAERPWMAAKSGSLPAARPPLLPLTTRHVHEMKLSASAGQAYQGLVESWHDPHPLLGSVLDAHFFLPAQNERLRAAGPAAAAAAAGKNVAVDGGAGPAAGWASAPPRVRPPGPRKIVTFDASPPSHFGDSQQQLLPESQPSVLQGATQPHQPPFRHAAPLHSILRRPAGHAPHAAHPAAGPSQLFHDGGAQGAAGQEPGDAAGAGPSQLPSPSAGAAFGTQQAHETPAGNSSQARKRKAPATIPRAYSEGF